MFVNPGAPGEILQCLNEIETRVNNAPHVDRRCLNIVTWLLGPDHLRISVETTLHGRRSQLRAGLLARKSLRQIEDGLASSALLVACTHRILHDGSPIGRACLLDLRLL